MKALNIVAIVLTSPFFIIGYVAYLIVSWVYGGWLYAKEAT